jgi:hypothetical protein
MVRPPAAELEEPDLLEVVPEVGLLLVEVGNALPELSNLHGLKGRDLVLKVKKKHLCQ